MSQLETLILGKYQVRKTKAQKAAFRQLLQAHFPEMKTEEGGFPKNYNLVFGDVDQAKVLLTAHYDTCIRSPLPNLMLPLRPTLKKLYAMVLVIPMLAVSLLAGYGAYWLTSSREALLAVYLGVYMLLFGFLFLWGRPNSHTANDNTSGVLTLLRIWQAMSDEQRQQAAIVLFDNEEYGCRGSGWLYKQRKQAMQEKPVLNFDCVSDGDHFILIATKAMTDTCGQKLLSAFTPDMGRKVTLADSKKASLSSDHKHFPKSVGIAAMHEHKWLKLYCGRIHTPRDTVFCQENLAYLQKHTLAFLDTYLA